MGFLLLLNNTLEIGDNLPKEYVIENGSDEYVTEDGSTFYITES